MLIELASHNDDIRRLLEKGYALRYDGEYLIVRDIPYLDSQLALQVGRDRHEARLRRQGPRSSRMTIRSSSPARCLMGSTAKPIPNLGGGPTSLPLEQDRRRRRSACSRTSRRRALSGLFRQD